MSGLVIVNIDQPPASLRGKLQRLMLEIEVGVFVGRLPAKCVQSLWEDVSKTGRPAKCITASKTEQGFDVRLSDGGEGTGKRVPIDSFGVNLIQYHKTAQKTVSKKE